jgi:hypothetical protein
VQSNKDKHESLTAEEYLEEKCRKLEMMVRSKDGIIFELRKELLAARFKVSILR